MRLSVVSTLYDSGAHLPEFHARMRAAADRLDPEHELVLVNDGCPGNSLEVALGLARVDPRVRVVDLSRNFGHHKAMMTGLAHARGERIFLIDCDLEEEPELLSRFAAEMDGSGADVVYGVQEVRKGGWFERVSGALFFGLFNRLSDHPVPANLTTVRLMSQRYVRSLLRHGERETLIAGLWSITGYSQVPLPVNKGDRRQTSYTLRRKMLLLVNALTSFSDRPLFWIFHLGLVILLASSAAAAALIVRRLLFGPFLAGWASIIVAICFFGGLILSCLGVIGIYLSKVLIETKQRPYTIVRSVYPPDA